MILLRKQQLFVDMMNLMCRQAFAAQRNGNRKSLGDSRIADCNQIVAQGLITEAEGRGWQSSAAHLAISTHFTVTGRFYRCGQLSHLQIRQTEWISDHRQTAEYGILSAERQMRQRM